MPSPDRDARDATHRFIEFLKQKRLKQTQQRMDVLRKLLSLQTHVNAEELFHALRKENPSIGYSTVYRTLKLLTECGIAKENQFGDRITRYESSFNRKHHDHIVCVECNEIYEFENEQIETLQREVAKNLGFQMLDHKLEIYGICKLCLRSKESL
ncbi:transcriptional repressor [bacterium]|jgi:Fur family transcriptional regulator, ferric uptake regulator|nr:transcriptional repressor [bacterium]